MAKRRNYCVESQNAVASPTASAIILTGGTTIRPCIYDMLFGASATPGDVALVYKAQRSTAAGTSTAYTPSPLDSADPVAITTAGVTCTAEPTYTSGKVLAHVAANQRATPRVLLDPDAPLIVPATSNNGIGLYAVHASFTGNVDVNCYFYE